MRFPQVGRDGDPVTITYGHNPDVRKMTIIFGAQVSQIILTPEEAEDMARQILFRAACARGEKPS
jgi:hypothetical protein